MVQIQNWTKTDSICEDLNILFVIQLPSFNALEQE